MASLIEETGYSYSGIADIVLNDADKAKELLASINEEYRKAKEEEESLAKQLEKVKTERAYLVSSFIYFLKARKTDKLVFDSGDEVVIVQHLSDNKIDYSAYERTQFQNQ